MPFAGAAELCRDAIERAVCSGEIDALGTDVVLTVDLAEPVQVEAHLVRQLGKGAVGVADGVSASASMVSAAS